MDVKNVNPQKEVKTTQKQTTPNNAKTDSSVDFKNELKDLEKNNKTEMSDKNINHLEEKEGLNIKKTVLPADNNFMINNDFSINDKDQLPQMNPNMNFSGDNQQFSSFMNNSEQNKSNNNFISSAKDLAEEVAILSSMEENLAMVNKTKIVTDETGVKKINIKDRTTVENIVKFDSIVMNQADVEIFANLVENKEINMQNISVHSASKAGHVSKTLADMLVKSMENNQPLRIDFDNNISVIIKISRDGKISADFLPSSQVAEAYLKENLPLLRQRFDENNIDYEELNQRERREQNRENNRKKGNKDE